MPLLFSFLRLARSAPLVGIPDAAAARFGIFHSQICTFRYATFVRASRPSERGENEGRHKKESIRFDVPQRIEMDFGFEVEIRLKEKPIKHTILWQTIDPS